MRCVHCDCEIVPFAVPSSLASYAPADRVAALCPVCLRTSTTDADPPEPASFASVHDSFPDGEGGAALALALGMLDSLAIHREAIVACCRHAEATGVDVSLTLDRLAESTDLSPHFDLSRRRRQLDQIR